MYDSLRKPRQSMLFHKPPNNNEIFANNIVYNEYPVFNLNKRMIKKPEPVTQPNPVFKPVTQPLT